MEKLIRRTAEKELLSEALSSSEAELIAVFGRRRVGKTFLIRSVFEDQIVFEFSGVHEATLQQQLENFSLTLQKAAKALIRPAVPANWIEAFYFLQEYLAPQLKRRKAVIFFDEFPWIHTPRSGFLAAFDHFWNSWASRQKNLVVVICGSAASWMIRNIVNNRGGLHNRITRKIRLLPFDLAEAEDYLQSRKVNLDRYQIVQLYMAMGGIPQYLKEVRAGESAAQAIDRLCFTKDGFLKGEFDNLYRSLFDQAVSHVAVIRVLAGKAGGMTRKEIIESCRLSSGGTATQLLEELIESGFITSYIPFARRVNDAIYKLSDEYSLFYVRFMENAPAAKGGAWLRIVESPVWKSWSGFAFESLCLKHVFQIKRALGISGIYTEESVWRYIPGKAEVGEYEAQASGKKAGAGPDKVEAGGQRAGTGAQIDLLIDRQDHCINICEMKYSLAPFTIDKRYGEDLQRKLRVFKERTGTRKTLFLTMVTSYGVETNIHYTGLVQNQVTMDALFEKT